MKYWLMKSEPDAFGLDDLKRVGKEWWDGVRNYQARNLMRDEMKVGDKVLFYHSNSKPSGVAGLAEVCHEATPDSTSWDPSAKYYDPKSSPENIRWWHVQLKYVSHFKRLVPLPELREIPELSEMVLLNRSRLSIQPVTKAEYTLINALGKKSPY